MPLTLPRRKVSDEENKLRLLCCINALGAVTPAQLWPFVASLELMEYLSMQLLLHELLEGGDLEEGALALAQQLFLTQQGREALGLFGARIMDSDRRRIRAAAAPYRARLRHRAQVRAVYESAQAGEYRVLLSLREGELPLFSLRLSTPCRDIAARALGRFEEKASLLLAYVYGLGTGEEGERVCPRENPALPSPSLQSHSRHEHTVTALLPHPQASLSLSLLLPDLFAAQAYRRMLASPSLAEEAARRMMALLCGEEKE